jgi:hypothetical protein
MSNNQNIGGNQKQNFDEMTEEALPDLTISDAPVGIFLGVKEFESFGGIASLQYGFTSLTYAVDDAIAQAYLLVPRRL